MLKIMTESCLSLNFLQRRNITDALDGYVILAFFLTFILTIVIVILLVRYISYNIKVDKEQQRVIANRKTLPLKVENENVDDSDDEFSWSESEAEDGFIEKTKVEVQCNTPSIDSTLDTNYINPDSIENGNGADASDKLEDLDMEWLAMWLNLQQNFEVPKTINQSHIVMQIFSSEEKINPSSMLPYYQQHLFNLITIRKAAFLQLVNFTIDLLTCKRILYEDKALSLKAKFEQQFERIEKGFDTNNIFVLSKGMVGIIQEFVRDLKSLSVEKEILQHVLSAILSQPLSCLKVFLLSISDLDNSCKESSKLVLRGITDCEKTILIIRTRFTTLKNAIILDLIKTNESNEIISTFENEIREIYSDFQEQLHSSLKNLCTTKAVNPNQLFIKLEQNVNTIRLDIINSTGNIVKKIDDFNEAITGIFVAHLEDCNKFLLASNNQQIVKIKSVFIELQNNALSKMKRSEKTVLFSLQEKLDLSNEDIALVTGDVCKTLKNITHAYDELTMECENVFVRKQESISKFASLYIEYIVKFVSSRYRTVLAANIAFFKSWPAIPEQTVDKLELSIKGKMSMVAFDVVVGLVSSFLIEFQNENNSDNECPSLHFDLENFFSESFSNSKKQEINELLEQTLAKKFLGTPAFEIPEKMLDYSLKEYFNIIMKAFLNLTGNFQKAFKDEVKASCQSVFFDNLEIYEAVEGIVKETNGSLQRKSSNSKYLSRKGKSIKEKDLCTKLLDVYQGLIDVKEHRYNEKYEELRMEDEMRDKQNKKSTNTTMKQLNIQLDLFGPSPQQKLPTILFLSDQYYMREMLLKKILQVEGDERQQVQRKLSTKSKLLSSPEEQSQKSPKKSTAVPKRRKSRKVGDIV